MQVHGYGLRDHLRFLSPLLLLVLTVWILRLLLEIVSVPFWLSKLCSVTAASVLALLIAVFWIHTRRFGSYPNVVAVSFLINAWAHLLIILAIIFSVITGMENIFTRPEFSIKEDDAYHIRHILGHLTFGIGANTLLGAGMGCLLLWLLRLIIPNSNPGKPSTQ
ncbi:MAG: hypothetical protein U0V70_03890 [Terriglobia bacterium]